jgi:hypothetical protein
MVARFAMVEPAGFRAGVPSVIRPLARDLKMETAPFPYVQEPHAQEQCLLGGPFVKTITIA